MPTTRCLVTNEGSSLDCGFKLFKQLADTEVPQLAYAWGVYRSRGISPNAEYPLFVKCDLGRAFDDGHWSLLPTLDVLKDIAARALVLEHSNEAPPDYYWDYPQAAANQSYHFVHFHGFPTAFVRASDPELSAEPFVVHQHPFKDFMVVQSRVHPYVIIANTALKILDHRKKETSVNPPSSLKEHLDLCIAIYNQWLRVGSKFNIDPPRPSTLRVRSRAVNDFVGTARAFEAASKRLAKRTRVLSSDEDEALETNNSRSQDKGEVSSSK